MKKLLSLTLVALCASSILAADAAKDEPVDPATAEDISNKVIQHLQSLTKEVANASTEKAFRDASQAFRFKDLSNMLDSRLEIDFNGGRSEHPKITQAQSLGVLVSCFDRSSKAALTLLVRSMAGNDVTRQFWRYDSAVKRVKEEGYIKEFEQFDSAWGGYMDLVKEMRSNKATGVTGSELLVASGLDKYAKPNSCTMSAHASRVAGSLDGILAKMTNDELAGFETAVKKIREYSAKLSEGLVLDMQRCDNSSKRISPAATKTAQDFLTHVELFVIEANKFADDADKLLATIRDTSTDIGKLRKLKGFSPNKAFIDPSPAPSADGHQRYVARIRMALIDAKKAYLDALAVCNKEARLTDQHPINGWK